MKLLGVGDIAMRWNYSRQGVRKLMKKEPNNLKPFAKINGERISVFLESDIVEYEKDKTWLLSEAAKRRRQLLFWKLSSLKNLSLEKKEIALENMFGKGNASLGSNKAANI
jgi:uncharacterized protein (UPF0128 family)